MKKIAVVTGASSGFGYEFSKLLAEDSYDLILIGTNIERLKNVKHELENKHTINVNVIEHDLSKPGSATIIYSLIKQYNIDVLINNAGFGFSGYFATTNWKYEEEMIHLHILTLTHLTKLVLADMITRGSGRIMNVSSVAAFQAGPLMAVYYATKAYVLLFSEALANEVKGTGVTVTVFCPGQTATNFQKTVAEYSNLKLSETGLVMADPVHIAKIGYKALLAGKSVCVPGMLNKLIVQVNRIMPRKATVSMVRMMQERIRK